MVLKDLSYLKCQFSCNKCTASMNFDGKSKSVQKFARSFKNERCCIVFYFLPRRFMSNFTSEKA